MSSYRRSPLGPSDGAMILALAAQWLLPPALVRALALRVHRASADVLDALDLVFAAPRPPPRPQPTHTETPS